MSAKELWPALAVANQTAAGQQQEHVQYNAHTQVVVQVLQGLVLMPAIAAVCGGLVLLGSSVTWLIVQLTSWLDWMVSVVILTALAIVVRRVARAMLSRWHARLWPLAAEMLATAAVVLLLMTAARGEWTAGAALRVVGGLGLMVGGFLVAWRFGNELWNPWFPKSPSVAMMERLIDRLTDGPEEGPERVRPYPVRVNGELRQHAPVDDEDEEQDRPERVVDPEFVDLVAFVEMASVRGLERDGLVTKPRMALPSGARLTRTVYDRMMELAEKPWGLVRRGGGGMAASWVVEPVQAVMILRAALELAGGLASGQAG